MQRFIAHMTTSSLGGRIAGGSFWAISAEAAASIARALSYFIYARLLSPSDFGLIGFCLIWINLFPLIIDNSLNFTLINTKDDDQATYSTIFWLNIAISLAGILLLIAGAGGAAYVLRDDRVKFILPIMGIQVFSNALSATQMAIARKKFQFRSLVPVRLASSFLPLGLGVFLAYAGYGYWALVVSTIAASAVQTVFSWALLPWRPSLIFDRIRAKSLTGFASWVAADMGVTWLVMSGGGFFLALFLGEHELGFFRLSDQLDTVIMGTIFTPLLPVFYSAFCEVADHPGRSKSLFERLNHIVILLSLTLTGIIVVNAHAIEALIGQKWRGIGDLLIVNAIADGLSYIAILVPSFLRAHGDAKIVALMRACLLIGQVLIYALTAARGLMPFLLGKLLLEVSMSAASLAVVSYRYQYPLSGALLQQLPAAIALVLSTGSGWLAASFCQTHGGWIAGSAGTATFVVTFGGFLFARERATVREIMASLKRHQAPSTN